MDKENEVREKMFKMITDIIDEHTALLNELYNHNIIPRFSRITQFGETRVRCELMKFELKGEENAE